MPSWNLLYLAALLTVSAALPQIVDPSTVDISSSAVPTATTLFSTIEPTVTGTVIASTIEPSITGTVITSTVEPTVTGTVITSTAEPTVTGTAITSTVEPTVTGTAVTSTIESTVTGTAVTSTVEPTVTGTAITSTIEPTTTGTVVSSTVEPTIIPSTTIPPTTSVPPPSSTPVPFFKLHPNGNTAKCLDVRGAILANGTPVQIFDCNGTPAQDWVIALGEGHVVLAGTNFCLDAGSAPANGIGMKIWECFNNLPAQDWFYTTDQRIALTNQGFCLDLTDGNLSNSNQVQTWKCTDFDQNQIWSISN